MTVMRLTMYKIYVVEDDSTIASLLKESLDRWGFESYCCTDFSTVLDEFIAIRPDLVLLDISLPYYNGFYWCAEIRKITKTPIIFVSSHTESMDIVMAVNMGADDYITKPFFADVIIAKITAVLRRTYSYTDDTPVNLLTAKGANLNLSTGILSVGETNVSLTKNELRILSVLLESKNNIISRENIMKALWDSESFIDDNTLTVNINRLRAKLRDAGLDDFISTKKGLGYCIYD